MFIERIQAATGIQYPAGEALRGFFSRFRPDGMGLDAIFETTGIEADVLGRIRSVFEATAPGWSPQDLYFVPRLYPSLARESAASMVEGYLKGFASFAFQVGEPDLGATLNAMKVDLSDPARARDEDLEAAVYECLTDFLATLQPQSHEIFVLKEALHSMASDYFLLAYMLCPAIGIGPQGCIAFDRYFDIWRHGLSLRLHRDGTASFTQPASIMTSERRLCGP